jgi:hypothetical protein
LEALGREHISEEHRGKLRKDMEDIDNIRIGQYKNKLGRGRKPKKNC